MGCYLRWAGLALYYISLMNDVGHLYIFFEEEFIHILCTVFNWVFCIFTVEL